MGQKALTIFTPADTAPHIYAEDDAQLWRALFPGSGITLADGQLALTIVDDNNITLASGMYSNQGYMICVEPGTTAALSVESGSAGTYRHDLVCAHFTRHVGDTADTHVFEVVKGANAATEAAAADPSIADDDSDNDLTAGASERQEALYRLIINGTTLVRAERIANYVGPVYQ